MSLFTGIMFGCYAGFLAGFIYQGSVWTALSLFACYLFGMIEQMETGQ